MPTKSYQNYVRNGPNDKRFWRRILRAYPPCTTTDLAQKLSHTIYCLEGCAIKKRFNIVRIKHDNYKIKW